MHCAHVHPTAAELVALIDDTCFDKLRQSQLLPAGSLQESATRWHGWAETQWNSRLPDDTYQSPETCSAKEAQALRDQIDDAKRRVQQAELAKASILSQVPILSRNEATAAWSCWFAQHHTDPAKLHWSACL